MHGFHSQGLAFQRSLHGDFLRHVFVELHFVPFERVHVLARDERVLGSLLDAATQTFRGGIVFQIPRFV